MSCLDHVVDQHGNTMSLQYTKESNKYATAGGLVDYDRGGYLDRIDYGTRTGSSATAPMNVVFSYADRCFSACELNENWPDTPRDLECLGSSCNNASPSFWTSRRVASVTTNLWSGSAPTPVSTWTFTHSFRDPEDGTRAGLILEKISQTGHVRVTSTVPDVTFEYTQMNNRVNPLWIPDHSPAMNWFRVNKIESESGGEIAVTYSTKDCYPGRMPDVNALQDNNLRCYPVRWQPSGHPQPLWDFFHKYVVTEIRETDTTTAGHPRVVHGYEYVGDPAWHYTDDDGMVKAENKTWSGWRGYGKVRTMTGTAPAQTMSETRYFRGMHGDTLPGGTRSVLIDGIADEDAFAGMTRESIVYNGPTGGEVSSEVTTPWQSAPTATRTINNTTVYARYSGVQETRGRVTPKAT